MTIEGVIRALCLLERNWPDGELHLGFANGMIGMASVRSHASFALVLARALDRKNAYPFSFRYRVGQIYHLRRGVYHITISSCHYALCHLELTIHVSNCPGRPSQTASGHHPCNLSSQLAAHADLLIKEDFNPVRTCHCQDIQYLRKGRNREL